MIRRESAIRKTVAASVGAKGFSVVCTLLQVPLAVHYLGTEAYGFWITLLSIVLVLNYVDFGIGVGMQHSMSIAYGKDDTESMRRTFWTGATFLSLIGVVILAAGLPLCFLLRWPDILKVHDPSLRELVRPAMAISISAFVIGLPFNAVARLSAAGQRGWIQAGWIAAGSACSLALVFAAARLQLGFLWFLAASLLVPVFQGTGLFIHLVRTFSWRAMPTALAPIEETRRMLRSSLLYALPQVGLALVQSCPAIAISMASGSSAVTAFTLLVRLFSPFQQGQLLLLTPVWPAYTEAKTRNDLGWIDITFRRTILAMILLSACVAVVAWQSPTLLNFWVGTSAGSPDRLLAALAALWCVLQMFAQPLIYYLIGIGELRRLAWCATPGLIAGTIGLFAGLEAQTAYSVLECGSAALAFILLPPLVWQTVHCLKNERRMATP